MEWRLFLREAFLLAISVVGWICGFQMHQSPNLKVQETIKLPKYIGFIFGKPPNYLFSAPGLLLQVLVVILTPVFTLMIFGYITRLTAGRWLGITCLVFSLLYILYISIMRK